MMYIAVRGEITYFTPDILWCKPAEHLKNVSKRSGCQHKVNSILRNQFSSAGLM